eukprot:sb/3475372/
MYSDLFNQTIAATLTYITTLISGDDGGVSLLAVDTSGKVLQLEYTSDGMVVVVGEVETGGVDVRMIIPMNEPKDDDVPPNFPPLCETTCSNCSLCDVQDELGNNDLFMECQNELGKCVKFQVGGVRD